jgi:hypothetical protein
MRAIRNEPENNSLSCRLNGGGRVIRTLRRLFEAGQLGTGAHDRFGVADEPARTIRYFPQARLWIVSVLPTIHQQTLPGEKSQRRQPSSSNGIVSAYFSETGFLIGDTFEDCKERSPFENVSSMAADHDSGCKHLQELLPRS